MSDPPAHPSPEERLREYHAKRDFSRTAEPRGAGSGADHDETRRRFAVQKHDASRLHYDLRFEFDGVLLSWAVPKGPSLDPAQKPLAVRTEDHPLEYAAFEGVIPEDAYGGGTVMLWDRGVWEPLGDPREGLANGDFKFRLHAAKLAGDWALVRMSGKKSDDGRNWLLIKKQDASARSVRDYNVLAEAPLSVASGRSMDEIAAAPEAVWRPDGAHAAHDAAPPVRGAAAEAPPETLSPQLCATADTPPPGDEWVHEIKLDGYRLLARIDASVHPPVTLFTRNGHDWTDRFPAVAAALSRLPVRTAWLDGEVIALDDDGQPDFQGLQNAFRGGAPKNVAYYVFDLMHLDGWSLREATLLDRKQRLASLLRNAPTTQPTVQFCDHIRGRGDVVYEQAGRAGLEGIVSKRATSRYVGRRSDSWRKVKHLLRESFVVGGFTPPSRTRTGFGALLLGQWSDDDELVYCGRVGTGFTETMLEDLAATLDGRAIDAPPFANPEADPDAAVVQWTAPTMVVDVEFTAWTNEGLVRHARYRGEREDIDPMSVRDAASETADDDPGPVRDPVIEGVRISNARRTVYPEAAVTKGEVAAYYAAVASRMLPYVAARPLSLVRCPLGLAGEQFFQRHRGEGFPAAVQAVEIPGADADEGAGMFIRDAAGLVALAQMGVLEVHVWNCRVDRFDRPDQLVFDLDPGPHVEWAHIVAAVKVVRDYLDHLGLTSFVKTTGGKGVHLLVPIERRSTWNEAKTFSHGVAKALARMAPENFTASMAKEMRTGRIYVDYLRNVESATAVAAYSTRARPGAHVSAPLAWDDLSPEAPPSTWTVRTAPDRLADDDPWPGYADVRQSITKAMRDAVGGA